jgi:hypothetical protein
MYSTKKSTGAADRNRTRNLLFTKSIRPMRRVSGWLPAYSNRRLMSPRASFNKARSRATVTSRPVNSLIQVSSAA